jgi:hypothetical protein
VSVSEPIRSLYAARVPQLGVAVDARMLKVDARRAVRTDDDLQLGDDRGVRMPGDESRTQTPTLSYHRFVQVPTCTPLFMTYVPHRNMLHMSARLFGVALSRHTMKSALSTIWRHEALFLSLDKVERNDDQIFRISVDKTPIELLATCLAVPCLSMVNRGCGMYLCERVWSACWTMTWRLRRISRSLTIGLLSSSSKTSNQSTRAA